MGNPGSEIEARVMVISGPVNDNCFLLTLSLPLVPIGTYRFHSV